MKKQTKEIPTVIYNMLTDLNIDRDFRERMARELGIEMPDDHEEEFKQCYNDKMLEDAYDVEQEEKANYFNNLDNDEQ